MKRLFVVLLAVCLLIVGGCGAKEVKMPFGPEERVGEEYQKVVSELDNSGFKKVVAEPVNTKHSDNVGKVESVIVDGKTKYKKAETFPDNVSVVVRYFKHVDTGNGANGIKFFK